MSNPPNAQTDEATGSRWYIHPRTGERFISVTTVLGYVAKFGLPGWAAKLTAEAAFRYVNEISRALAHDPCNSTGEDACGLCRPCFIGWLANRHNEERDRAASVGTRLHEAAEQRVLFGPGAAVDEEIRPLLDWYVRWLEAWKPEFVATEMTVISRKYGYAGTLDKIVRLSQPDLLPPSFQPLVGLNLVGDTKTGKHVDIINGWQVNAYAHADAVLLPDGSEEPMPQIGGGLIVHVRPDKLQVRRVEVNRPNFARFIHLLRVADGLTAGLNTVLSRPFTLKETQ